MAKIAKCVFHALQYRVVSFDYLIFLFTMFLCVQNNVTASYAKLALFYDWMFYKPAHPEENIMNVGM